MIAGHALADRRLAQALAAPVARLQAVLDEAIDDHWRQSSLLEQLVPLSAGIDDQHQLAELVLNKTLGAGRYAPPLADELRYAQLGILRTFQQLLPDLAEQLALRGEPLKQQWEARGPGLFHRLGQLTESEMLVEESEVVLVHPVQGGGGAAHLAYNTVRIEAVLANPHPQLPEVVRLGWLLAQLQQDLPRYSEHLPRRRLPELAALALLPPVLLAAEDVELARYDEPTVKLAFEAWHLTTHESAALVQGLMSWWETYFTARPRWAVALGALKQMTRGLPVDRS